MKAMAGLFSYIRNSANATYYTGFRPVLVKN